MKGACEPALLLEPVACALRKTTHLEGLQVCDLVPGQVQHSEVRQLLQPSDVSQAVACQDQLLQVFKALQLGADFLQAAELVLGGIQVRDPRSSALSVRAAPQQVSVADAGGCRWRVVVNDLTSGRQRCWNSPSLQSRAS